MKRKIDYKGCVSGIIQRGEEIFPPAHIGNDDIIWSWVNEWLEKNPIEKLIKGKYSL